MRVLRQLGAVDAAAQLTAGGGGVMPDLAPLVGGIPLSLVVALFALLNRLPLTGTDLRAALSPAVVPAGAAVATALGVLQTLQAGTTAHYF